MNKLLYEFFGVSQFWDVVSNIFVILMIAGFAIFPVLGLIQWIKRKNMFKADKELLCMVPSLVMIVVIYFLFMNVWVINYRPDGAEPSFPSSHTLTAVTLCILMSIGLRKYIEQKWLRNLLTAALIISTVFVAFGRLASGMHWFSDVCGGIVFGVILGIFYAVLLKFVKEKTGE